MGMESDDIDLALDDMYGQELAEMLSNKMYEDGVAAGTIDPSKQKK